MSEKFEVRSFAEFRVAREGDAPVLEGYAIVFNSLSEDLGGFREMIAPVAVDRALTEKHDVRALIDHDASLILGRSRSGTLEMTKDDHGLLVKIKMPDTSYARDLAKVVERGDVSGMSFSFLVTENGDTWHRAEDGTAIRTVIDMEMRDVSVVTYPAYPATDVALRSLATFVAAERAQSAPPTWRDELAHREQGLIESLAK